MVLEHYDCYIYLPVLLFIKQYLWKIIPKGVDAITRLGRRFRNGLRPRRFAGWLLFLGPENTGETLVSRCLFFCFHISILFDGIHLRLGKTRIAFPRMFTWWAVSEKAKHTVPLNRQGPGLSDFPNTASPRTTSCFPNIPNVVGSWLC